MAEPIGWSVLRKRFDQQFLSRPAVGLNELFGRLIAFQAQSDRAARTSISIRMDADEWNCQAVRTWSLRGTLNYTSVAEASDLVLVTRDRNINEVRRILGNHGVIWGDALGIAEYLAEYLQRQARAVSRLELRDAVGTKFGTDELDAAFSSWGGIMKLVASMGLIDVQPGGNRTTEFRWLAGLPQNGSRDTLERIGEDLWTRFSAAYGPCEPSDFARWLGLSVSSLNGIVSNDAAMITRRCGSESSDRVSVVLPEFDPYIATSASRSLYFSSPEVRTGVVRSGGWLAPTIVFDGLVVGFAARRANRRQPLFLVDPRFLGVVSDRIGSKDLYRVQNLTFVRS